MTAIDDKYATAAPLLGAPVSFEEDSADGGRFRNYELGAIYWHPQTGAHEVHGAIFEKYRSLGAESGLLGYPLTDESPANRGGRYNHFVNGSIYWRAETGAFWIRPQTFEKWETMEWERGVGFPLSDPVDTIGGEVRQRFEKAVMIWTPQDGISVIHQPAPLRKVIRGFLVSWSDVSPPPGYTQEFFHRYFFGVGQPITNPEGGTIPASVYDYFSAVSDGFMQVSGVVMPWVTNPIRLSEIVHWAPPEQPWPRPGSVGTLGAIVAQTLRTLGIRNMRQLEVDGIAPDALVFCYLDVVGGGGVTRPMERVKDELQRAGRMDLWDSAWDNFLSLPVTMTSCTYQEPAPSANPDSTYPTPPPGSLHWMRSSALHHELVHALLSFIVDIYSGNWNFYTWYEVMSYSVITDWPIPMSSYVRERSGLTTIRNLPRETHSGLDLFPLETHSTAMRFQNGPLYAPEELVIENRRRFDYRQNPPPPLSNIVFAYAIDLKSRRVQSNGFRLTGHAITRGNVDWADAWGLVPGSGLTARGPQLGNTLNYAGEHWWSFEDIRVQSDERIRLNAMYQPRDLVKGYQSASWFNSRNETIMPNMSLGEKGQVLLVGRSIPIADGRRYDRVLSIHPDWYAAGAVWGNYEVEIPAGGARLYVTVALSEWAAGSDGVQMVIRVNDEEWANVQITLERNVRTVALDLSQMRGRPTRLAIGVLAGSNAVRDWAYILEAVIVPMAEVAVDLFQLIPAASWRTNSGSIPFNGDIGAQGHARQHALSALQDGVVYGPHLLYTHPAWRDDGFVEGAFPLTLPTAPSVFRAQIGFPESRSVTDNGAMFSVSFVDISGAVTPLLMNGQITRSPAMGTKGLWRNAVLNPAVPIPGELRGRIGNIILRIDAAGSATEDQVYWTMARITSD